MVHQDRSSWDNPFNAWRRYKQMGAYPCHKCSERQFHVVYSSKFWGLPRLAMKMTALNNPIHTSNSMAISVPEIIPVFWQITQMNQTRIVKSNVSLYISPYLFCPCTLYLWTGGSFTTVISCKLSPLLVYLFLQWFITGTNTIRLIGLHIDLFSLLAHRQFFSVISSMNYILFDYIIVQKE